MSLPTMGMKVSGTLKGVFALPVCAGQGAADERAQPQRGGGSEQGSAIHALSPFVVTLRSG
jgi:hypothetical protein